MKISVNNKEMELPEAATIALLAHQLQLPPKGVAIAVHNAMVPRTQWDGHMLHEGDDVVIIKAACGG